MRAFQLFIIIDTINAFKNEKSSFNKKPKQIQNQIFSYKDNIWEPMWEEGEVPWDLDKMYNNINFIYLEEQKQKHIQKQVLSYEHDHLEPMWEEGEVSWDLDKNHDDIDFIYLPEQKHPVIKGKGNSEYIWYLIEKLREKDKTKIIGVTYGAMYVVYYNVVTSDKLISDIQNFDSNKSNINVEFDYLIMLITYIGYIEIKKIRIHTSDNLLDNKDFNKMSDLSNAFDIFVFVLFVKNIQNAM